MGRYTGPKEKLSRRAGLNLFLKGARSFSQKNGMQRKPYAPGQHGQKRASKPSNYGEQLAEKQKVKRIYGVREKQFKNLYVKATKTSKVQNTDRGLELLRSLEMRLDNVVYLLGLAPSRSAARQFVTHKHIEVNGKVLNIPSYVVKIGDKVGLKKSSMMPTEKFVTTPAWLDTAEFAGSVIGNPARDEIDQGIRENLIIEFYSR